MKKILTGGLAGLVASVVLIGNSHAETSTAASAISATLLQTDAASAQVKDDAGQGWAVDYDKSAVTFTGDQQDKAFSGTFASYEATIRLDPANLESAMIEAVVDMSSVDAGSAERNDALPTKDWFAVKSHETATFHSSDITQTSTGEYEAAGTMTIKGVSNDMVLPFTLVIEGDTARAEGSFELMRTDYNVGTGAYKDGKWVGLTVSVTVDITATR